MALQKRFLHQKFPRLPTHIIGIGVALGLITAVACYGVLTVGRDFMRFYPFLLQTHTWDISAFDLDVYNYFLAFFSLVFGQSVCFGYWVKSAPIGHITRTKSRFILHDQRNLNWFFFAWLSRISTVTIMIVGWGLRSQGRDIISPNQWMLILCALALFLHPWLGINRVFRRSGQKWMVFSLLMLSVLSYPLGQFKGLKYATIDAFLKKTNSIYNYQLELPVSNEVEYIVKRSWMKNVYVSKDTLNGITCCLDDGQTFVPKDFNKLVVNNHQTGDFILNSYFTYLFFIDSSASMKTVIEVVSAGLKAGINRVAYATNPSNGAYISPYYCEYAFRLRYGGAWHEFGPPEGEDWYHNSDIQIQLLNQLQMVVDGKTMNESEFRTFLRSDYFDGSRKIIGLTYSEDLPLAAYIHFFTTLKHVKGQVLDSMSLERFDTPYRRLVYMESTELSHSFPINVWDLPFEKRRPKSSAP